MTRVIGIPVLVATLAVTACDPAVYGNLGPGLSRPQTVRTESTPRPKPDANGVISYPSYQVVQAREGDTVADVAARIGLQSRELARYNGLAEDQVLRRGEILALPRRVATGGSLDIENIASSAIDRAEGTGGAEADPGTARTAGVEPIRHKVERGETVYSIARLYAVSVRTLAQWNNLGPDLTVREGQFLLVPVAQTAATEDTSRPGQGSVAPNPPSSTKPLPASERPAPVPPSPNLGSQRTADSAKMLWPVDGPVIGKYSGKGGNEGIDIRAAEGTTVRAAANGTVALVSRSVGSTSIVLVRHADNIFTVYANVVSVRVKKGEDVARGQPLGKVAKGDPSALHFEVRRGTDSTDPMPFLE